MSSLTLKSLKLTNFKKHRQFSCEFEIGSNMVIGPNYQGKTSIVQAIMVGLFGSSATSIPAVDLVSWGCADFKIELELASGHTIVRTLKNATMARAGEEPYVRGHSSVNKAVGELIGLDRNVFTKVFVAGQGSTERLLNMEGAELQRFLEGLVGIDRLDAVVKEVNRRSLHLQGQIEGLVSFVLSGEEVARLQTEKCERVRIVGEASQSLEILQAQLKDRDQLRSEKEGQWDHALQLEKLWLDHDRRVSELNGRLSGMVEMEVPIMGDCEDALARAEALLQHVRESNRDQREVNRAWDAYQLKLKSLRESIIGLKFTSEEELDLAAKSLKQVASAMSQWRDASAAYKATIKQRERVLADLGKLEEVSPITPSVPDYESSLSTLNHSVLQLKTDLSGVTTALHNATCPTCKRDMEGVDKTQLALDFDRLTTELAEAKQSWATLQEEFKSWQVFQAYLREKSRLSEELEQLGDPVMPDPTQFDGWEMESARLEDFINTGTRANRLIREAQQSIEKLRAPKLPYQETLQDEDGPSDLVAEARAKFNRRRSEILEAEANNNLLNTLRQELAEVQGNKPLERYNVDALRQEVKAANDAIRETAVAIDDWKEKLHEAELALSPIREKLEQHEQAYASVSAWGTKAEDYKRISEIITNSRSKFIEYARHTVFGVVAEFCKLATNGDMEDVKFDEVIMFQEQGRWVKSGAGSGAQRSLLGLGMMFGIATLVKTPWETMLFDEAGAAMSDSISMSASMAMESLCKQSVSITHRQLDVAGNVIEV